jgi:hypothetical protein
MTASRGRRASIGPTKVVRIGDDPDPTTTDLKQAGTGTGTGGGPGDDGTPRDATTGADQPQGLDIGPPPPDLLEGNPLPSKRRTPGLVVLNSKIPLALKHRLDDLAYAFKRRGWKVGGRVVTKEQAIAAWVARMPTDPDEVFRLVQEYEIERAKERAAGGPAGG